MVGTFLFPSNDCKEAVLKKLKANHTDLSVMHERFKKYFDFVECFVFDLGREPEFSSSPLEATSHLCYICLLI